MAHDTGDAYKNNPEPEDFRRRDGVAYWQGRLAVLALVVVAVWWALDYRWPVALPVAGAGGMRHSPGPLAHVHAAWDSNCTACHPGAEPLNASSWVHQVTHNPHASDATCQQCHAGPPHHPEKERAKHQDALVPGCTACHQDHHGRDANLLRSPDRHCTVCHAEHQLDRQHPAFQSLADAPKLKFNHQLHLSKGLQPKEQFSLAQVAAPFREFYRLKGQTDRDLVQLRCDSCHQLDASAGPIARDPDVPAKHAKAAELHGLPGDALLPARGQGAAFLPINYENHCQACHPVQVEKTVPLRHRLQPAEIRQVLEGQSTARWLQEQAALPAEQRRVIGRVDGAAKRELLARVREEVLRTEQQLFGQSKQSCAECHFVEKAGDAWRLEPTQVPPLRMPKAVFNHASHRLLDCKACHNDATTSGTWKVSMPKKEVCVTCHSPARQEGTLLRGGARADCVECHRYHHGEHPLQGKGAPGRLPSNVRDLESFLRGTP
jgi:predicted CXXCH cytochrome family protein